MKTHVLKTQPPHFAEVVAGEKRFELRKNDRDFCVGDTLRLREFFPIGKIKYSGAEVEVMVTHIMHGPAFGLELGYSCMSIVIKGRR